MFEYMMQIVRSIFAAATIAGEVVFFADFGRFPPGVNTGRPDPLLAPDFLFGQIFLTRDTIRIRHINSEEKHNLYWPIIFVDVE